jgi:glycosyltransferase involved in cell wall biosynthesis
MNILFINSREFGLQYPQRADHLLDAFAGLGNEVTPVGFKGFFGTTRAVFAQRKIKKRIFTGFKAGAVALMLRCIGLHYEYDCVEWKQFLCEDNWHGIKRHGAPIIGAIESLIIRFADKVYTAGFTVEAEVTRIRQDYIRANNGYDRDLFDSSKYNREELRKAMNIDCPILIYTGKLTEMYSCFLMPVIDAVSQLETNLEFWIFGDGESRESLENYAHYAAVSNKVANRVKFCGYIEYDLTPKMISIADIGVNAYRTESLKMIEWSAMGLPILSPQNMVWNAENIMEEIMHLIKRGHDGFSPMPDTWQQTATAFLNF